MLGESPRPHSRQGDLGPQSGWGWTQVTQHFLLHSEKFVLEFSRETPPTGDTEVNAQIDW